MKGALIGATDAVGERNARGAAVRQGHERAKQTIEKVAAWAAFYSQARTAGRVPVIGTCKKRVRKPRGGKAGLALVEREKSLIVKPREPEDGAMAGEEQLQD